MLEFGQKAQQSQVMYKGDKDSDSEELLVVTGEFLWVRYVHHEKLSESFFLM